MPSLCRLSTNSRFCLNQLGTKMQDSSTDCLTLTNISDVASCGSTQNASRDENSSFGGSSRANCLISLVDICDKMLLPIDALQQQLECDTFSANTPSLEAEPVSNSRHCAMATSGLLSIAVRQTNQHQPMAEHDHRVFDGINNANSYKNSTQDAARPTTATISAAPMLQSEKLDGCPSPEDKKHSEQRLLSGHGVPFWSMSRYFDFRAEPLGKPTQLFHPVLEPRYHRHMIIEDSYLRMKAVLPSFRTPPVYRPQ